MSEAEASANPKPAESFATNARKLAVVALFAAVLLVPKMLHLRRDPRSWLAFRIVLGLAGAALVVLPLGLWNAWLLSIAGLAMFMAAALLPPAKPNRSRDDKARELGALVVLNGGNYQPANGQPAAVQLFVGDENLWALDRRFHQLLVIPVAEIRSLQVYSADGVRRLRLEWPEHAAEFDYRGFFAEHLANVAETTIRSVMRTPLPVLQPQRRAASA